MATITLQLVNTGNTANDGTGDSPRSGALKINGNAATIQAFLNALGALAHLSPGTGLVVEQNGTVTVDGLLVSQIATQTPLNGAMRLVGADSADNLLNPTLTALLVWITSQATNLTTATAVSSSISGDQVLVVRNGAVVLLPTSALGSGTSSGGGTTPSTAATFTVAASPSSVAVGQAINLTVTPGPGGWQSGEVVTPSAAGIAGSFDQATKTGSGTNAVVFVFTPSAAGSGTLSASAPNMTLSGSTAAVTATAASSGGTTNNSGRPPMTLSGVLFETAAPLGGGTSLKGGAGVGTATIALAASGAGSDQSAATVYFRFQSKGGAAVAAGGPFLQLAPPNSGAPSMTFAFDSGNLVVTAGGGTKTFALRDGAAHEVEMAWNSYNNTSYIDVFIDGAQVRVSDGGYNYIAAGNAVLTYTGARLAAGDLIDDIEVKSGDHTRNGAPVTPRSLPVAPEADTLALYQFESQSGTSS